MRITTVRIKNNSVVRNISQCAISSVLMRRGLQWYREPPDEELGRIVSALNTPSDPAKERLMKALGLDTPSTAGVAPLRLYVEAWVQSGPNSRIFAKRHPKLWAYVREPWKTLEEKPFLLASECGMAELVWTWLRLRVQSKRRSSILYP